ncbi:hypothetical protein HPP92_020056 [Vanilla planifolia]|uniref:Uncharacterized protein n=1 Tax=Vanilla planifolia TaxID=51239 RepID=A0A835UJH9_VANPL|nr:hypothetical protein HPP92_020056 [Vanilla planifolia]
MVGLKIGERMVRFELQNLISTSSFLFSKLFSILLFLSVLLPVLGIPVMWGFFWCGFLDWMIDVGDGSFLPAVFDEKLLDCFYA